MSFSEWKKYKVGEFCETISKTHKFQNGKVVFLNTGDIEKGKFLHKTFSSPEGLPGQAKKSIQKGDILLSEIRPANGRYAFVDFDAEDYVVSTKLMVIRAKENISPRYLYHFLTNSETTRTLQHLAESRSGTFPQITFTQVQDLEILVPELKTQKQIASFIDSIDDTVNINQQINKTLEEMAKAIFKEWFVDFNFPNATGNFQETEIGKIPVGWKSMKLNEALEIKYGKDHKHLQDGKFPVYGSGGIMRYAEKPLYESESILIPRKGTLSNLFYINKPFWTVDTMFYSKIKIKNSGKYLFHLLQTLNLASMNVGSAVPSLTTEVLNNIQIAMPDENTLKEFKKIVSSLFNQAEQNIEENQSLMNLRDTLLPKLMKGEININL